MSFSIPPDGSFSDEEEHSDQTENSVSEPRFADKVILGLRSRIMPKVEKVRRSRPKVRRGRAKVRTKRKNKEPKVVEKKDLLRENRALGVKVRRYYSQQHKFKNEVGVLETENDYLKSRVNDLTNNLSEYNKENEKINMSLTEVQKLFETIMKSSDKKLSVEVLKLFEDFLKKD